MFTEKRCDDFQVQEKQGSNFLRTISKSRKQEVGN